MTRAALVEQITTELGQLDEARLAAVLTVLGLVREGRPAEKARHPKDDGVSSARGLVWSQAAVALANAERLNMFGEAAAVGGGARVVMRP